MKKRVIKLLAVILAIVLIITTIFISCAPKKGTVASTSDEWNTNYKYVFVHGLSGWGSYDTQNKFLKYWGMFNGDMLKYLDKQGFECYSASVDPQGSAWDRACELYAQLTGSVVDYGKEHSERCNHERFGYDYSENPLIDEWNSDNKINLLGHSFGGATIRLLSDLMADGSEAEIEVTDADDISPLFTGGKGDWIYSITCLAAPHNGTSAYESNDVEEEDVSKTQEMMSEMVSKFTTTEPDGRADYDYAAYDLHIDNALKLNEELQTQDIYYFSIPCSSTIVNDDNTCTPNEDITESTFITSAIKMGKFTGVTENGFEITEEWFENDGLVNTISATAPFNAPSTPYNKNNIQKGVWNVFDTYTGDHMSLQGGLFKKNDVKDLYVELLNTINML